MKLANLFTLAVTGITVVLFSGGCASYPKFKGNPIYYDVAGRKMCSLHKMPLVSAPAYKAREGTFFCLSEKGVKVENAFPNAKSVKYSFFKSKEYYRPQKVEFCIYCEEASWRAFGSSPLKYNEDYYRQHPDR